MRLSEMTDSPTPSIDKEAAQRMGAALQFVQEVWNDIFTKECPQGFSTRIKEGHAIKDGIHIKDDHLSKDEMKERYPIKEQVEKNKCQSEEGFSSTEKPGFKSWPALPKIEFLSGEQFQKIPGEGPFEKRPAVDESLRSFRSQIELRQHGCDQQDCTEKRNFEELKG